MVLIQWAGWYIRGKEAKGKSRTERNPLRPHLGDNIRFIAIAEQDRRIRPWFSSLLSCN